MKTLAQLRWAIRKNLRETGQFLGAANAGTVSVGAASAAVVGVGTSFTTDYQIGDEIMVAGIARSIVAIISDVNIITAQVFGVTASTQSHYLVTRQGGWTDDDINDELNSHKATLQNRIWRDARKALYGSQLIDVVQGAGGDMITLPTAMLSIDVAEYRQSNGEAFVPLGKYEISQKDSSSVAPWLYPQAGNASVQKPTGRPTFYTVVSPSQIELNTYPAVATPQGLRLYGPQRFNDLILETDTLGLPEVDGFEHVLELFTTAHLLKKEKAENDRAAVFERDSEEAYRVAIAPWQAGGRDTANSSVVLLD